MPEEQKKDDSPVPEIKEWSGCSARVFDSILAVICGVYGFLLVLKLLLIARYESPSLQSRALAAVSAVLIVGVVVLAFSKRKFVSDQSKWSAWIRAARTTGSQLLVTMVLLAASCMSSMPGFLEAQVRSKVTRTRTDMRSLAMAIEAYRNGHGAYPQPESGTMDSSSNRSLTFVPKSLSTPLAYVTCLPSDVFAKMPRATFAFAAVRNESFEGWIALSCGPDRDYDIEPAGQYDPSIGQPSPMLLKMTYDPTNGTYSGGDIWRVRE